MPKRHAPRRKRREPEAPKSVRIDAAHVRLTRNEDATLTLVHGKTKWARVRVRLGRPLYRPKDFATVLDAKGQELALIVNLPALSADAREALEVHGKAHNLTCTILKINSLDHQFGAAFWDVATTKGRRQFVIRGTTEHVRWLTDDRLLITDVAANRFEIPSLTALDKRSQDLLALIL